VANEFTCEEWSKEGKLTETVATSTNGVVARAAFKALVELRPKSHLLLRQGARVVAMHEPGKGRDSVS
jgi:hypothetical protein